MPCRSRGSNLHQSGEKRATSAGIPRPPVQYSQEHSLASGAVSENLGISQVPGKLDSESFVAVTMSRSPRRTIVVVWTRHGPLRLSPTFSAWIETSSRVPSSFTLHTVRLY